MKNCAGIIYPLDVFFLVFDTLSSANCDSTNARNLFNVVVEKYIDLLEGILTRELL